MTDVKIRGVDKDIITRLDVMAKKLGFKSRQKFLQSILIRIALEEVQFESDIKYQQLIRQMLEAIKLNTSMLAENNELFNELLQREAKNE